MLFSELYGTYYNTVAEILRYAVQEELSEEKIKAIVSAKAFGESTLTIPSALKSGKWKLITEDCQTPLLCEPKMPLTTLQKRWLKAISLDRRVRLFDMDFRELVHVEPLFTPDMIYYYDQYADGDDFADEGYIMRFRIILRAVRERCPLTLRIANRRGSTTLANVMPEYLEYSEKDDKFRLITSGCRYAGIVKLSSVLSCKPYTGEGLQTVNGLEIRKATVSFTLFDGRNTLERAMLHFAHFEKTVEKVGENHFTVHLLYDPSDETELLIRILSFGPFIKVTAPSSFVNIIKERLKKQKRCGIEGSRIFFAKIILSNHVIL